MLEKKKKGPFCHGEWVHGLCQGWHPAWRLNVSTWRLHSLADLTGDNREGCRTGSVGWRAAARKAAARSDWSFVYKRNHGWAA